MTEEGQGTTEENELLDLHMRAVISAFVKAQSFNKYWCTSFGDRVEIAFGTEKRMLISEDQPGHMGIEYPVAVSMPFDMALQLHTTLGSVLAPYIEHISQSQKTEESNG